MPDDQFTMTFDEASSTWTLTGDAEEADIEQLRQTLEAHQDRSVVVDLTSVTYLPSKMIGTMAVARRDAAAHGGAVQLRAKPDTIADRLLRVMGLAHQP